MTKGSRPRSNSFTPPTPNFCAQGHPNTGPGRCKVCGRGTGINRVSPQKNGPKGVPHRRIPAPLCRDSGSVECSKEKEDLNFLSGLYLVASRLTWLGYHVDLHHIEDREYGMMAFDASGNRAIIEVASAMKTPAIWPIRKASSITSERSSAKKFIFCVDFTKQQGTPDIYVFPENVLESACLYHFRGAISQVCSFKLSFDYRPNGVARQSIGEYIEREKYLGRYDLLGLTTVRC